MKNYDAIVIGSGQGGGPLAFKLADLGWKVALTEREHLGGSCINYGCTPTKAMIASASVAHYAKIAPEFGVHPGKVRVDMPEVVARKNKVVESFREGQRHRVESRSDNLDLYQGHGRFSAPHEIEVDGERLASDKIFINTGTRPRIIPIPGLEQIEVLTNRNIMELDAVPEHLLVLGGNYLGLEFGQMFCRFGSKVTVVELADQIIPREDPEVSESLKDALEAEGMRFHLGAHATQVAKTGQGIQITIGKRDGSTHKLDGTHVLVSIGQVPNTDDLGLERAGVETDKQGFIRHDAKLQTSVPGIWVIGDAKGGPAFTHVSYDDYLVIYDNLVNGAQRTIENRLVPYALYTNPELGRVGLTEKEARAAGYRLKIGTLSLANIARAIERSETKGLMKIVINADNDRILGATILGPDGGELVQILMALMMADAPWMLFKDAMFIHPTLAEGFFSLMGNVEAAK